MYSAAPTFAELLDKLFAEQSARIAKIEAEHAKWEVQLEKMLAETNAIIKSLAADITGGR